MTTYRKINALCLLFALLFAAGLQAQVSIGSLLPPEPAALLQIKEYDATTPGGETADKGGVLLPRLYLNSVTDITVVANASAEQKAALTGLMVYNENKTGGMEEGICEWNGSEWILLETESKHSGSKTTKAVARLNANELTDNNVPLVNAGIFEFRIKPPTGNNWKLMAPQMRLAQQVNQKISVWYHIARFWDYNASGNARTSTSGSSNPHNSNEDPPKVGYTYEAEKKELGPSTTLAYNWTDLHTRPLKKDDTRFEVWVADPTSDHVYNVQFIYAVTGLSKPFCAVIVTEY
jgi:hypothetical protein